VGWTLYDLANTVFYLLAVTIYVPKYIAQLSGRESTISYGMVPAMLLSAALAPALGAVLRRHGWAKGTTLVFTGLCCLSIAPLGFPMHWGIALFFFAVSLFAYQMAAVSYHCLLPVVAPPSWIGRVSGIGVALGYLGNVLTLVVVVKLFDLEERLGIRAMFPVAAIAFAGFTLPFLLWVPRESTPEPTRQAAGSASTARRVAGSPLRSRCRAPGFAAALGSLFKEVRGTGQILRRTFRQPSLRWFLIGNFLVCDAINTVLIQIARYVENDAGLGLDAAARTEVLISVNLTAVLGGFVLGAWADRSSGKRVAIASAVALASSMGLAEFAGNQAFRVGVISLFGGAGIAGVWTAGRLWLLDLVPKERASEAFGLYGLTMKASLLSVYPFTAMRDRFGDYRISVGLVTVMMLAGVVCWSRANAARELD